MGRKMGYRDKIQIGVTQAEIVEILGHSPVGLHGLYPTPPVYFASSERCFRGNSAMIALRRNPRNPT